MRFSACRNRQAAEPTLQRGADGSTIGDSQHQRAIGQFDEARDGVVDRSRKIIKARKIGNDNVETGLAQRIGSHAAALGDYHAGRSKQRFAQRRTGLPGAFTIAVDQQELPAQSDFAPRRHGHTLSVPVLVGQADRVRLPLLLLLIVPD